MKSLSQVRPNRAQRILTTFLICIIFGSCQKENKKPIETAAPEATALVNGKACYIYAKSRDTITMSLVMNANNANGELVYDFNEKDRNEGTFSGIFIGDTLFADYNFNAEGQSSVREAIFLRNGDILTEGHGEMEERDNKMVFRNPKKVRFDDKSIILTRTDCDN